MIYAELLQDHSWAESKGRAAADYAVHIPRAASGSTCAPPCKLHHLVPQLSSLLPYFPEAFRLCYMS